jgi:hypothetical protein
VELDHDSGRFPLEKWRNGRAIIWHSTHPRLIGQNFPNLTTIPRKKMITFSVKKPQDLRKNRQVQRVVSALKSRFLFQPRGFGFSMKVSRESHQTPKGWKGHDVKR